MSQTQLMGVPHAPVDGAPPPEAFGKYRVLTRLGEGGFGSVWRCQDDALDRQVAVKAMSAAFRDQSELKERFLREARALARVNNPGVVQVFDVGETSSGPFFVMELVSGRDLASILRESGPLDEARALHLCRQAVLGLSAAAAAGVVHRDVKPANLMVTGAPPDERVKVTDFGLAFPTADAPNRMTSASVILGTPEYISPEQARGAAVDHRADQYSLGCTLYELLTGRPPFTGSSAQAVVSMHLSATPDPPRVHRPNLTGPAQNLVLRLMSREPEHRFPTWDAVLSALEATAAGSAFAGPPPTVNISGKTSSNTGLAPVPHTNSSTRAAPVVTENLALCFVDLLEFQDRTTQQTRDENAQWVGDFTDGMKRLIRQRGGRFIKQAYGSVLCTFGSPTDAVLFGMSAVDAAWEWSRGRPAVMAYAVRVGINLGEVRVDRGDVFGDPVNVAARVMSKAATGEVWFSDAVWLAMNRKEVDAEGMGPHDLKGVPVPVRLFRALPVKSHVAGEHASPFGTRGYGGSRAAQDGRGAIQALDKGAAAVASTVSGAANLAGNAARRARPVWNKLQAVVVPLWQRIPAVHRPKVAAAVVATVVLVAGGWMYGTLTDPYRRERALLADGKAGMALRTLEQRLSEGPEAQWLYARALYQTGRRAEALEPMDKALLQRADLADDEALDMLLDALDMRERTARRMVVRHFGRKASGPLKERVLSERYHTRHNAAEALQELGLAAEVDVSALALKDIRVESECSRRLTAVRTLEDRGTPDALSALMAARNDPGGDPRCVMDSITAAEKRLARKASKANP